MEISNKRYPIRPSTQEWVKMHITHGRARDYTQNIVKSLILEQLKNKKG